MALVAIRLLEPVIIELEVKSRWVKSDDYLCSK